METFGFTIFFIIFYLNNPLTNAQNYTELFSLPSCKANSVNSTPTASVSVIGGNVTQRNEFPWIINIRIAKQNYVGFCGGSLIDWNLVVTSAHCLVDKDAGKNKPMDVSNILVTAGGFDTSCFDGSEQYGHPESILIHPNYDQLSSLNDIALIKMKVNFNKTKAVRPIPIPSYNMLDDVKTGVVAGWGSTETDTFSKILRKANLDLFKVNNCKLANVTTQFCAGGNGKDACKGDSGGPFMCNDKQYFLCGIVTSGIGAHCGIYPGTYTNVFPYLNWIITNRNFGPPNSSGFAWWLYILVISAGVFLFSALVISVVYVVRRRKRFADTSLLGNESE